MSLAFDYHCTATQHTGIFVPPRSTLYRHAAHLVAVRQTHSTPPSLPTTAVRLSIMARYWDPAAALQDDAYAIEQQRQYFFGRDFIIRPITEATTALGNTTTVQWHTLDFKHPTICLVWR